MTGKVSDPDGSGVLSVLVESAGQRVAATEVVPGFWRARNVPLARGSNTLTAIVRDMTGASTTVMLTTVRSEPVLRQPSGVALDEAAGLAYVSDAVDGQLWQLSLADAALTPLASLLPGLPFSPSSAGVGQIRRDAQSGALFAPSGTNVVLIDPATGERKVVASREPSIGGFGRILAFLAVAPDAPGDRLFAVEREGTLYRSNSLNPPQPAALQRLQGGIDSPVFIADALYLARNNQVYVTSLTEGLFQIDPETGIGSELSGFGLTLSGPAGLAEDPMSGELLVVDVIGQVFRVDPASGARTLIYQRPIGEPVSVRGLAASDQRLVIASPATAEVLELDRNSRDWRTVTGSRIGSGVPLGPGPLRRDATRNRLITVAPGGVLAVDIVTGERSLIAAFPPAQVISLSGGPQLLDTSPDGGAGWTIDVPLRELKQIDLLSGAVSVLALSATGAGPELGSVIALAVDAGAGLAYVVDGGVQGTFEPRLMSIELASGNRTLLVDLDPNQTGLQVKGLLLDRSRSRLLVDTYTPPATPITVSGRVTAGTVLAVALDGTSIELVAKVQIMPAPNGLIQLFFDSSMTLAGDNRLVYGVSRIASGGVLAVVSLPDGIVTVLDDPALAIGPTLFGPFELAASPNGACYALDLTGTVFSVDVESGERLIVSK